jgi:hypothetical protein
MQEIAANYAIDGPSHVPQHPCPRDRGPAPTKAHDPWSPQGVHDSVLTIRRYGHNSDID